MTAARTPLVTFVIPLIAKANCSNWSQVMTRLRATLASIGGQLCTDYGVLIVCNERPDIDLDRDRVSVLTLDLKLKRDSLGALDLDKERKLHHALLHLRAAPPHYVMFLDGDDLVSRRLVSFVSENQEYDAFLVQRGYMFRIGSNWIRPVREFYRRCGSCYLFRYRYEETPDTPEYDWSRYWMLTAHNKDAPEDLGRQGYRYVEFPFPAVIYTQGQEDSIRARYRALAEPSWLRRTYAAGRFALQRILQGQRVTPELRRDFGGL